MIRIASRICLLAAISTAWCGAVRAQTDGPDTSEQAATRQLTRSSGAHFFWNEDNRVTGLALVGERNADAALRLSAQLPLLSTLTVTSVNDRQFSDDGMQSLSGMSNLVGLYLTGTDFTDRGVQHIGGLTGLTALRLNGNLTDDGLTHLQNLASLQLLDLYGARVSGTGLGHLSGMQSLQTLILDYTHVDDEGLQHLAALSSLENLHIRATEITDVGLPALDELAGLLILSLDGTAITGRGVAALAPYSCYTDFQCDAPPAADRPHLVGKSRLQQLSIRDCSAVDADSVLAMANLMGLTDLQLVNLDLEGSAIAEDESALQKLQEARGEIAVWRLIGAAVEFHETDTWSVRMLSFTRPDQNALLSDLANPVDAARLQELKELSLQGALGAGGNALAVLRSLPSLEILDLRSTSIDGQSLVHLEELVNLRVLDLRSTPITQQEAAEFESKLKANQSAAGVPETTCILVAPAAQT